MRVDDMLITIAYFSIPVQLLVSLFQYPRLASMPWTVWILLVLFAFFIFLCGAGHLLKCLDMTNTTMFEVVNTCTAIISIITAIYLLPLVPHLMSTLDDGLQRLVKLNQETEESRRKLSTFMAFLCHEIRNPLFCITANLEFVYDIASPKQLQALDAIQQSSTLMLRLVNDVLDISKLDAGKLVLEEREIQLHELLTHVASSFQSRVKPGVDMKFEMDRNAVPKTIVGDAARLLQIVYNLLSNATKFTKDGSIHWSVRAKACDAPVKAYPTAETKSLLNGEDDECSLPSRHALLEIQVTDTGPGISQAELERIFEPYAQSKLSHYRKYGGTGLGLSIVKRLVGLMGGTIEASSVEGQGSTFTVRIPFQVVERCEQDVEAPFDTRGMQASFTQLEEPPAARQQPLVLVVDDNSVNRKLIARMLQHCDVDYELACNGKEAVEKMLTSQNHTGNEGDPYYHMILMDLSMPVMDGIEATRLLREHGMEIPVLALTANTVDSHKQAALDAGATEFLTKPILRDDLRAKCLAYCVV